MHNFIFLGMSIDNQAFPFLHTTPYTQHNVGECLLQLQQASPTFLGDLGYEQE
jgi:hypothetical protein